ncbi:MAG: hypothetical protein WCX84_04845 [Syntrophales bacterium]|jgi:hypothetical protein|nr:hypothetical protein [Syntrophales bacterium]NLN60312.1 hypothetical protein [Deltaproteobacteria bacterium]
MTAIPDEKMLKEIQSRFEKKLKENEIESVEFWKGHVDRMLAMKPEGVAALQTHIRKLSDMMANRVAALKKGIV